MEKFVILGGRMERRNIKTLHELAEEGYDLIINCSGLGARELIADKTMTPIRGQVYKVIDLSVYIVTDFFSFVQIRVIYFMLAEVMTAIVIRFTYSMLMYECIGRAP